MRFDIFERRHQASVPLLLFSNSSILLPCSSLHFLRFTTSRLRSKFSASSSVLHCLNTSSSAIFASSSD
ncbi:unnamed protein product [Rhizophagus irregularis]|nr:unnamed protein product [Rhizophagus irregularis]CAB4418561.1 unnamed protein product [Rhizophagus irregularis]